MTTFKVSVTREDRWWVVTIPELDGYRTAAGTINVGASTQARRFADITREASDYIATVTDLPFSKIALAVTVAVDDVDVTERAARVRADRAEAEQVSARAQLGARELAKALVARGVTVRDVGEVLGVSFQRAHQLIK